MDSATPPTPPSRPPAQPMFNAPPATVWLCLALAGAHGLLRLAGMPWQQWALETFAFVPAWFLAQFDPAGPGPSPAGLWPLVTHAFLHLDLMHLVLNAGFLLAFGSLVERRLGGLRFLCLFAFCAAAGALAQAFLGGAVLAPMIGASGGVYGLMGAAVRFLFAGGLDRRLRRAVEFIAVIMGLNLALGLLGIADLLAGAEVAWQAHVGGFAAGLAAAFLLAPGARPRG